LGAVDGLIVMCAHAGDAIKTTKNAVTTQTVAIRRTVSFSL